jgi:uncharacterized protein (UPF0264 family)
VAELLVSVRSPHEARTALAGGAAVIDVKEPARGPLGCADFGVWRSVVDAVAMRVPVSVALGELGEWPRQPAPHPSDWRGIAWRKLGLAGMGSGPAWIRHWLEVRDALQASAGWIAVIYADRAAANSPLPDQIVSVAAEYRCAGVLIDTYDKRSSMWLGGDTSTEWGRLIEHARSLGLLVALAGGLDADAIRRLKHWRPDLFAVRGAACKAGMRSEAIEKDRVARLAAVARGD